MLILRIEPDELPLLHPASLLLLYYTSPIASRQASPRSLLVADKNRMAQN
jgi:hypothetical protein